MNEDGSQTIEAARAELRSFAEQHLAAADAEFYANLARPAIRLEYAPSGGQTHLGGLPVLAPDVLWPTWRDVPLAAIAVLDLAELALFEPGLELPREGTLSFFYDARPQAPWGIDAADWGAWRLHYCAAGEGAEQQSPPGVRQFATRSVAPLQMLSSPGWEDAALQPLRAHSEDALLTLEGALRCPRPRHQVGGWPELIQGPIDWIKPYDRAAQMGWKFLAQFDSDAAAGFDWGGDDGVIAFAVPKERASIRDFENSSLIVQAD